MRKLTEGKLIVKWVSVLSGIGEGSIERGSDSETYGMKDVDESKFLGGHSYINNVNYKREWNVLKPINIYTDRTGNDYLYITDIDEQQEPFINNYKNRNGDDPVRYHNMLKINGIPNLFGPMYVDKLYSQEMHLTINDGFLEPSRNNYKTTGFGIWLNENSQNEYINSGTLDIIDMEQITQIEKIPYTIRAVYMWPDWISTGRNLSQPDLDMKNFYKFSTNPNSIHQWNVTIKHTGGYLDGTIESHNIDIDASSNGELGYWTNASNENSLASQMADAINEKFDGVTSYSQKLPSLSNKMNNRPEDKIIKNYYGVAVLKPNGHVDTWGYWNYTTSTDWYAPDMTELNNVVSVTCNHAAFVALRLDGTLYGWGSRNYGALLERFDHGNNNTFITTNYTNVTKVYPSGFYAFIVLRENQNIDYLGYGYPYGGYNIPSINSNNVIDFKYTMLDKLY